MSRVLVAMSGGVDSSCSVCLLKEEGFDCVGVTMVLSEKSGGLKLAKQAAEVSGCGHLVLNYAEEFKRRVILQFVKQYEQGLTPNPCVLCNRLFKFGKLLDYAVEENFDYLATGHYAKVEFSNQKNCFVLKRAVDLKKDQTYFLFFLNQGQLSKVLFPLGGLKKTETKQLAASRGLESADGPESQDICFIGKSGYVNFIKQFTEKDYDYGNFVNEEGQILGRHEGIINYTVGQRKGLKLALSEPFYVKAINLETNEVVLAPRSRLFVKKIALKEVNLIFLDGTQHSFFATVKLRYSSAEFEAEVFLVGSAKAIVKLEQPQVAPSKGQVVVFYDGELVVGGGTVEECFD